MKKCFLIKKTGFTLIEIVVASAIFIISFGALCLSIRVGSVNSEKAIISLSILHRCNSLLEIIQSYPYDQYPKTESLLEDSNKIYNHHYTRLMPAALYTDYNTIESGVYTSLNTDGIIVRKLPEEALSIKYHPTTVDSSNNSLNPFNRTKGVLWNNAYLLGPEYSDVSGATDLAKGIFKIAQAQLNLNSFQGDIRVGKDTEHENPQPGDFQARAFYFNDVDDFDGYREVVQIYGKVVATIDVSVSMISNNKTDYKFTVQYPETKEVSLPSSPLSIMNPISFDDFDKAYGRIDYSLDDNDIMKGSVGYYREGLMKKIVIKATWEYPENKTQTLVIQGGVIHKGNKLNIT